MDKYNLHFARKLNKLLVYDLEATCWADESERPHDQVMEIIEFGLSLLSISKVIDNNVVVSIEKSASILVKPQFSKVSTYCEKLTGHTMEELKRFGSPYPEACNRVINEFHCLNIPFCSWGQFDYNFTLGQEKLYPNARFPFSHSFYNLSPLFSMKYGLNKKIGVAKALSMLGMEFEGRPHSGVDDSKNIARIATKLIWNQDLEIGNEAK